MDRKEIFRQVLISSMNKGYLNDFVSIVFDYNLEENDFIYAQYKIIDNNIILDIFDNNVKNRFSAYMFVEDSENILIEKEVNNEASITYLYIDNCYKKYKKGKRLSNLLKLAASFRVESQEEFNNLIKGVFPKEIEKIIYEEIEKERKLKETI